MNDDDRLVNLNARIRKSLWRRVKLEALRTETPMRDLIRAACAEHLARQTKGGGSDAE